MIYKFLFPSQPDNTKVSLFLLAIRIIFGLLLMSHGIQKWNAFEQMSSGFPDPLGVGTSTSLILVIFAELVCSAAFVVGFLHRLSMIPMITTMSIAFFVIHAHDAFVLKELAFIYLSVFVLMYFIGPGIFSVDRLIYSAFPSRK